MATSTIAGSITSTDFNVIQGLKDVNGNPLTYEGTPSKTWKIGDQILKNEKEGFSVRNEDDTEYGDLIVRNLTIKEDIVFGGSAFIIDTEEVKVTDNILTLNSGEQGEGVTKGISGLEIDRENFRIILLSLMNLMIDLNVVLRKSIPFNASR